MGGLRLCSLLLLALHLRAAVAEDGGDTIAACTAHVFCPQIPNITCCPNRQGEFLPCCSSSKRDMSLCTAHPGCPAFDGVSCCPDPQGEFLPCCSNTSADVVASEQVPTNAAQGTPASIPDSESICSAHVETGCPALSDHNCCPNGYGVFLPCCAGVSTTVAPFTLPATTVPTAAATAAPTAPAATTTLPTVQPTTELPTVLPTTVAMASESPPSAAPQDAAAAPAASDTEVAPPAADYETLLSYAGTFVTAGTASMYWVNEDASKKHQVYASSDCAYCGCKHNVSQMDGSLMVALPDGEPFTCSMILGQRGRFMSTPGSSSIYWQDPNGGLRHPLNEGTDCTSCGCGGKIETLSADLVGAIPEGPAFECSMMPEEARSKTTPMWLWLLIGPFAACILGPLIVLAYMHYKKKRSKKQAGRGVSDVGEGDKDEEANAPLIARCTCSNDRFGEYEETTEEASEMADDAVELPGVTGQGQSPFPPGQYRVVVRASVTAGLQRDSREVAMLEVGTPLRITEVVNVASERRVRGRVENPPGWVSLWNDELGFAWLEFVAPL